MTWWLSDAARQMRREIDRRYPERDKRSDGAVGDTSHQARPSDHNPDLSSNPPGVVRAIDIDKDLSRLDPKAMDKLAERIRRTARKDDRITYIIWNGRIASSQRNNLGRRWGWRPYTGPNPHNQHIHVSFAKHADHDGRAFRLYG